MNHYPEPGGNIRDKAKVVLELSNMLLKVLIHLI